MPVLPGVADCAPATRVEKLDWSRYDLNPRAGAAPPGAAT
jgi:hypothetical protein